MTSDQAGITTGSASMTGRSASNYKSSVTRSPSTRIDGRSSVGKRIRDLYGQLMQRLNQPADIMVQADIMALVELKVAAEIARSNLLTGKVSSSNELVRLENLVRRTEARVGLEPGAGMKVDPPDWRDLIPDDDEEDEEQPTDDGVAP